MKPTKLTMQAFGPFANSETILFDQLGENPLFLINGPTGSGKTSILDAICFALYGETTGDERQGIQMRCDMAQPSMATEVTLEFSLRNKRYRVIRSPEQQVPKARGDGMTTRKHNAALYDITGEVALVTSKTAQVKTEVAKLIGLNETQFRQVMVLPQGKFRELLLATSKEREEIFGQLFQTDIYKKIEFALKDKANAISKAKDEFDNQIRGALQVAGVSSEEELNEQQQSCAIQFEQHEKREQQALSELNKLKVDLQKAESLHAEFTKREQAEKAINQHLQGEESHKALKQQFERAKSASNLALPHANWQNANGQSLELTKKVAYLAEQLQKLQAEEKAQQTNFEHAKRQAEQIPKLTEQQYALEGMKSKLVEKAALEKTIADGLTQQTENEVTLKKFIAHKEKLTTDAHQGQQSLEKVRVELATIGSVEADIQTKTRLLQDLHKLTQINGELAKLNNVTANIVNAVQQAQNQLQQRQFNANSIELNWHNGQAAILAQRLEANVACPVCGSYEHPQPAQFLGEAVTKEQVQQARTLEREAQAKLNQLTNQLEQHNIVLEQHQQQINQLVAELGENVQAKPEELQSLINQQSQLLQHLRTIDLGKLEHEVEELNKRCVVGEAKINELHSQMAANQSTIDASQAQLNNLVASLDGKYNSLVELEQEIVACQNQVLALNKALDSSQQQLQQAQLTKSKSETEWQTHQTLSQQANEKLAQVANEWQSAILASDFDDEAQFLQSKANDQTMQAWQQEIDLFTQTQIKLTQTLVDLNEGLKGQERPDLTVLGDKLVTQEHDYNEAKKLLDSSRSILERLKKVSADIVNLHQQNAKLEEEYKVFGTLYDVASGKTGSRISLHRFVLGVLLDDVLIQASQRLSLMSKGRYILERKTEGFKGAAGRGLDLVVEDGYTGKTRDVATLSGGESFMAALALALGLSDVVQSYSGGIRLDTLFIDEGFGSLDPESLDLAIQTLVDLQQSGRMIGVISHVSELKEQMAQRIDVTPSRLGSTVSVQSLGL